MATGEKYLGLTNYLKHNGKDSIKMTFAEIESKMGEPLVASAYAYPAFWSNSTSHAIAYGWLNADYRTEQVNLREKTIVFRKVGSVQKTENKVFNNARKPEQEQLNPQVAAQYIRDYFYETVKDEHGRYKSWEHCYEAFRKCEGKTDKETLDYLSLHLAFYLASWGMYRGSSFLLQKDYRVHIPIVRAIQEPKYNVLRAATAESFIDRNSLNLLMELSERIRKLYAEERPSIEGVTNNATDTLVTKILLGALGCVPAYDRYYVQAVKQYNISVGQYNADSVRAVAEYYVKNKDIFESVRAELSRTRVEYPPMKLMDMCMWQAAFIEENNKEA